MNMDFVFMFDQFKLDEQCKTFIWLKFKFKFGVILQMTLQHTSFKWFHPHIRDFTSPLQDHFMLNHFK